MKRKYTLIVSVCFLIVFLFLRLPGVNLPYHQDEWKNVGASSDIISAGNFFAHPPLMALSFVLSYELFGENNFRFFPLIISLASAVLLFKVVKKRAGGFSASVSLFLFALCFYSILGSVQPDVDGSIVPLLFLICIYLYDNFIQAEDYKKWKWLVCLSSTLLIGLLIKLSFIIILGVIIVDYIWVFRKSLTMKKIGIITLGLVGSVFLYVLLLYFFQLIFPNFSISFMLGHANQFTGEGLGRNYTQIIVQGLKAIFYLSPLLLVPLLFITREVFNKTRIFAIYLFTGFIFYFIIFDFSRGALDKYLMFSIVPLVIIIGIILGDTLERSDFKTSLFKGHLKWFILSGLLISSGLFLLNFFPRSDVLALYPKTEWFSSVLHLKWNILNPFTGGSGPTGFYVSFVFIAGSFIVSFILVIIAFIKRKWAMGIFAMIIMVGFVYNITMFEELSFGKINGNVSEVIDAVSTYLGQNNQVKQVLSYNDIGADKFSNLGKYAGRFYATPDFEAGHKLKFVDYNHYVVVDIPHIYEYGFYGRLFSKCQILFEAKSGRINGRVYDCSEAKKYYL